VFSTARVVIDAARAARRARPGRREWRGLVRVAVVRPADQAPYLRTQADGVWTDDLLALPTF
jgi:hypothetical protein